MKEARSNKISKLQQVANFIRFQTESLNQLNNESCEKTVLLLKFQIGYDRKIQQIIQAGLQTLTSQKVPLHVASHNNSRRPDPNHTLSSWQILSTLMVLSLQLK